MGSSRGPIGDGGNDKQVIKLMWPNLLAIMKKSAWLYECIGDTSYAIVATYMNVECYNHI